MLDVRVHCKHCDKDWVVQALGNETREECLWRLYGTSMGQTFCPKCKFPDALEVVAFVEQA